MKDHFGREILEGMLVVAKPTGRYGSMKHGISNGCKSLLDKNGYAFGGSDQVIVDTANDPDLEKIRQDMLHSIELARTNKELEVKATKAARIKQKDFKIFGVYDDEMYLGAVHIDGIKYDSGWLKVYMDRGKEPFTISNYSIVSGSCRRGAPNTAYLNTVRDCKYPTKLQEVFVVTKEEFLKRVEGACTLEFL